jgi:hypothetical protein
MLEVESMHVSMRGCPRRSVHVIAFAKIAVMWLHTYRHIGRVVSATRVRCSPIFYLGIQISPELAGMSYQQAESCHRSHGYLLELKNGERYTHLHQNETATSGSQIIVAHYYKPCSWNCSQSCRRTHSKQSSKLEGFANLRRCLHEGRQDWIATKPDW